jgi:uncharacterized GH25 family protein
MTMRSIEILRVAGVVLCASIVWITAALPARAHDFWLQPERFQISADSEAPFTLQVGHGPQRQRSPIPLRRITRFTALGPHVRTVDLGSRLALGENARDGAWAFTVEGAWVVALETDFGAQSHLPAARFNDYLSVEGLTPAVEERQRGGRSGEEGSERYCRQAKAIVQVGVWGAGDQSAVTARLGLELEIVLEDNPYAPAGEGTLPVRVYYRNRPLAGALVKLTDLDDDAAPFETYVTDRGGRAHFTMPRRGRWLLNVIWTRPLPAREEVDFETIFSSLSFGFDDDS